ncbi:hypothetical protein [Gemmatimonas groenlandica]|uniref:Outer membrane protein beta-barrel domain-containing protein n=1 Tax=Gemmatimonas groenlandica TaxID=2732249 RepID=A0A6M4IRN7_9BACT|nr:hypothetical protein [Gemmatimonas groenlandica]QJR36409.1 hypothetical protein HKW67_13290 [Gemmatimonas groenlandica]
MIARNDRPRRLTPLGMAVAITCTSSLALAQSSVPKAQSRTNVNTWAVMAGLSQPILFGGGNVEVEYLTRNFVVGWSHGAALQIDRFESGVSDADKAEQATLRMPWTTGPSLGYRITNRLNVTLDLKAHRVKASLPGGSATSYSVYTVGPAVGYNQPIGQRWFIQPLLRWWPTVGTSLTDDTAPLRRADGSLYQHKALDLGFVPNVKIGFRF